jgi:hypothetical protein
MIQYKATGTVTYRFTTYVTAPDTDHADDEIADAMAAGNFDLGAMVDYDVDYGGLEPSHDFSEDNPHVHPIMREVLTWSR